MNMKRVRDLALAAIAVLAITAAIVPEASAKGDMSRRCKELTKLTFGTDDTGYAVSQKEYNIETGVCYKLEIASTGNKEYALKGAKFFRNMWVRKIEAGGLEIKAFALDEIEFEREGECELFFTMIVPGTYTLSAAGLESKGTVVTFKVK